MKTKTKKHAVTPIQAYMFLQIPANFRVLSSFLAQWCRPLSFCRLNLTAPSAAFPSTRQTRLTLGFPNILQTTGSKHGLEQCIEGITGTNNRTQEESLPHLPTVNLNLNL